MKRFYGAFAWSIFLLVALALTGCAASSERRLPTFDESIRHKYLLEAGDTIELNFPYHPELSNTLRILPDGTFTLPMIGRVTARGKAPYELEADLTNVYARHLVNPNINVVVRQAVGQRVYVAGEVFTPGMYTLSGQMTVLHAVMAAGGMNVRADGDEVILLRRSKDGRRLAFRIDLDEAIDSEHSFQDIPLQPYDVVIVPKSFIAALNDIVLLYIDNMLPQKIGFDYVIGTSGSEANAFASSQVLIGN